MQSSRHFGHMIISVIIKFEPTKDQQQFFNTTHWSYAINLDLWKNNHMKSTSKKFIKTNKKVEIMLCMLIWFNTPDLHGNKLILKYHKSLKLRNWVIFI